MRNAWFALALCVGLVITPIFANAQVLGPPPSGKSTPDVSRSVSPTFFISEIADGVYRLDYSDHDTNNAIRTFVQDHPDRVVTATAPIINGGSLVWMTGLVLFTQPAPVYIWRVTVDPGTTLKDMEIQIHSPVDWYRVRLVCDELLLPPVEREVSEMEIVAMYQWVTGQSSELPATNTDAGWLNRVAWRSHMTVGAWALGNFPEFAVKVALPENP